MNESLNLTSDEKLLGAVSHFFGPLVAVFVWATQKEKSRFVKFQALQALAFDLFIAVTVGIFFFCLFGLGFLGMFVSIFSTMENASTANDFMAVFFLPFIFPFLITACATPVSVAILALRLIAGISVLNGKNYQYPFVGKWLENFIKE